MNDESKINELKSIPPGYAMEEIEAAIAPFVPEVEAALARYTEGMDRRQLLAFSAGIDFVHEIATSDTNENIKKVTAANLRLAKRLEAISYRDSLPWLPELNDTDESGKGGWPEIR